MSLRHDFYIIESKQMNEYDYSKEHFENIDESNHLAIDDDLFLYMKDTFSWTSTLNPATNHYGKGFNYWGVTVIEGEGLETLLQVVGGWIKIFSSSDDKVCLTGLFTTIEGDNSDGAYEKLYFEKDKLLTLLNLFRDMIIRSINQGNVLLHRGI